MMKKMPWYVLPVGVLLIVLGVLVGRWSANSADDTTAGTQANVNTKSDKGNDKATAEAVMTVEAVGLTPAPVADTISANGIIAPKETAEVSAKLTGATIERVFVDVGDVVKAGQTLAIVDSSSLQDTVVQARADLAQAEASLEKTKADLARIEPLLQIDAVSRQEVDAHRTALRQAEASVVASQARLKTAQTSLNNSRVVAPVSGVISEKSAQVGTLVSGSPLFSIIKDGVLEWQATLDPTQATKISLGQPAIIIVGDNRITGQVSRLSPTANNARDITVNVTLPKGTPLKSGMYQTGEFILSQAVKPAVPVSALLTTDGYDYVLTLKPTQNGNHQVTRTKVIAGERVGEMVAVSGESLSHESLVVRQSGSFLNDGDVVKVAQIAQNNSANSNSLNSPNSQANNPPNSQNNPNRTQAPPSIAKPDSQPN